MSGTKFVELESLGNESHTQISFTPIKHMFYGEEEDEPKTLNPPSISKDVQVILDEKCKDLPSTTKEMIAMVLQTCKWAKRLALEITQKEFDTIVENLVVYTNKLVENKLDETFREDKKSEKWPGIESLSKKTKTLVMASFIKIITRYYAWNIECSEKQTHMRLIECILGRETVMRIINALKLSSTDETTKKEINEISEWCYSVYTTTGIIEKIKSTFSRIGNATDVTITCNAKGTIEITATSLRLLAEILNEKDNYGNVRFSKWLDHRIDNGKHMTFEAETEAPIICTWAGVVIKIRAQ